MPHTFNFQKAFSHLSSNFVFSVTSWGQWVGKMIPIMDGNLYSNVAKNVGFGWGGFLISLSPSSLICKQG